MTHQDQNGAPPPPAGSLGLDLASRGLVSRLAPPPAFAQPAPCSCLVRTSCSSKFEESIISLFRRLWSPVVSIFEARSLIASLSLSLDSNK